MRLVVDTNVFVSAALKQVSTPGAVICWLDRYGDWLKIEATEQELMAVPQRPRIAAKIAPLFMDGVRAILADATLVTITEPCRRAAIRRTTRSCNLP